ncbi:MAG: hypothetical protein J1E41_04475 [Ruminococcus sp.]|nr:hypothetical protein [Ruminococcus sp.]
MFSDLPEEFREQLQKNFCAMKYVHNLSDKKRKKVIEKAQQMNSNELKNYVAELGNFH